MSRKSQYWSQTHLELHQAPTVTRLETEQLEPVIWGVFMESHRVDLQLLDGALCNNPYHLISIALV